MTSTRNTIINRFTPGLQLSLRQIRVDLQAGQFYQRVIFRGMEVGGHQLLI